MRADIYNKKSLHKVDIKMRVCHNSIFVVRMFSGTSEAAWRYHLGVTFSGM